MKNITGDGDWSALIETVKKRPQKKEEISNIEIHRIVDRLEKDATLTHIELSSLYRKYPHKTIGDGVVHSLSLLKNIDKLKHETRKNKTRT